MKVIYGIGKVRRPFKNSVLAIGVFDGVHLGHQQLIKLAVKEAKKKHGQAVVMTFDPHPVHVLKPSQYKPLILPLSYRIQLIERYGADACIVVSFTKSFSHLTAKQFIKKYIVQRISPKKIIVGDDFRFGATRDGDLDVFRSEGEKYGFKLLPLKQIKSDGKKIGSTLIRGLIAQGKLKRAENLLGRHVAVCGEVERGDNRGKELGFPTANIYPKDEVIPPSGVYAVAVHVDSKKFYGMANVGLRPSFQNGRSGVNIEVHIFSFHKEIYGKEIIIEFIKKIRNEKKFHRKEGLIKQLKSDQRKAKAIFQ